LLSCSVSIANPELRCKIKRDNSKGPMCNTWKKFGHQNINVTMSKQLNKIEYTMSIAVTNKGTIMAIEELEC